MTNEELEHIIAVCAAATPGPWHWVCPESDQPIDVASAHDCYSVSLRTVAEYKTSVGPLPRFIIDGDWNDDTAEARANLACLASASHLANLASECLTLRALVAELERNDARYRWLRECVRDADGRLKAQALFWNIYSSRKHFDAAIDIALAAQKEAKE